MYSLYMTSVEMTVTEARARISDVTSRAEYGGETVYLTRNGHRAAAVVPAAAAELLEELEEAVDAERVADILAHARKEEWVPFRRRTRRRA